MTERGGKRRLKDKIQYEKSDEIKVSNLAKDLYAEYEQDKGKKEYQIPKEMDALFKDYIETAVNQAQRKRITRNMVIAASFLLILGIGSNAFSYKVYGTGVTDFIRRTVEKNRYSHDIDETVNSLEILEGDDVFEVVYTEENLSEIFDRVRKQRKQPTFNFEFPYETYEIIEAKYSLVFNLFNMEIRNGDGITYISQEDMYDSQAASVAYEKNIVSTVLNEYLDEEIEIFTSVNTDEHVRYIFSVYHDRTKFFCDTNLSLEDIETIAKNLKYN